VGRDAEKADLHAALHRAINPATEGGYVQPDEFAPPTHPSSVPPPLSTGEPIAPSLRQRPPLSTALGRTSPPGAPGRPLTGELVARAIVGEMGIGKTTLVTTFLGELPGDIKVISIECSPVTHEIPFATVSDMLRIVTEKGLDSSIEEASYVLRRQLGPPFNVLSPLDMGPGGPLRPEASVPATSSHRGAARTAHAARIVVRLAELITGKQREHADDEAGNYRRDLVIAGVRALLGSFARA